jgi:transposase-like protein
MYDAKVPPPLISNVMDAVSEDVKLRRARPLDAVYPLEIRKVIYTTNVIESMSMSIRKVTKTRSSSRFLQFLWVLSISPPVHLLVAD